MLNKFSASSDKNVILQKLDPAIKKNETLKRVQGDEKNRGDKE